MMTPLKLILIACISSLLCTNALAGKTQFYKWTDKDGVVHYSETPPKDKEQDAKLVTTKTKPASEPEEEEKSSDEASGEAKTLPSKEKAAQVLKKNPEACKQATDALNSLMSKPIIRKDGKVMTIEEKNQEIQNMKDIQKIHC